MKKIEQNPARFKNSVLCAPNLRNIQCDTNGVLKFFSQNLYFRNQQLCDFLDWRFEIHNTKIRCTCTYPYHLNKNPLFLVLIHALKICQTATFNELFFKIRRRYLYISHEHCYTLKWKINYHQLWVWTFLLSAFKIVNEFAL